MPYDDGNSNNFINESFSVNDNSSGLVYSDGLSNDNSLFLSDSEQSGNEGLSEDGESSEYNTDYSDILGGIYSDTTLCNEQIESLSIQLDSLNTNLCILNDNLLFGLALLFILTLLFFVKFIYNIFIKILGLGQA